MTINTEVQKQIKRLEKNNGWVKNPFELDMEKQGYRFFTNWEPVFVGMLQGWIGHEVEEANKLGMDVIITDHHLAGPVLPKALAIVNPNQKGDKYPFKSLCGSAVVFKLVQALIKKGLEQPFRNEL